MATELGSEDSREASSTFRQMVNEAFRRRRAMGLVPYEGRWLAIEEAAEQARRNKDERRIVCGETVVLIGLILASSAALLGLLALLAY